MLPWFPEKLRNDGSTTQIMVKLKRDSRSDTNCAKIDCEGINTAAFTANVVGSYFLQPML